jgi:hypothetical protein
MRSDIFCQPYPRRFKVWQCSSALKEIFPSSVGGQKQIARSIRTFPRSAAASFRQRGKYSLLPSFFFFSLLQSPHYKSMSASLFPFLNDGCCCHRDCHLADFVSTLLPKDASLPQTKA